MRILKYIPILTLLGQVVLMSGQARINEVLAYNYFDVVNPITGLPGDWVEIYNPGDEAVSFLGCFLSDDRENLTKWSFPSGLSLPPGEFLILLADGTGTWDDYLHLNFKLKVEGETLYLSSPTRGILDSLAFPRQYMNESYGWTAAGDLAFFETLSPGEPNDEGSAYRLAPPPVIGKEGGVYPGEIQVSLSGVENGRIRYTLDGSIPVFGDLEYNGQPITIAQSTVLRARQWINGTSPGETVTATYVIHPGHSLPVVALSTEPDYLWSDMQGMYVIGKNGITGYCSTSPRNWNQDWEVDTHMEYFDRDGQIQVHTNGGLRIHGGCSRTNDLKSLAFVCRNRYGSGPMDYPFFSTKDADQFKAFILRNAGNDCTHSFLRDPVIMTSVRELDVDQQDYQPVVVYLNGEYWGIMNLREKVNEHWVTSNYGLDTDSLDFLENGSQVFVGSGIGWSTLMSFMENNSLADEGNYQWVAERLDIHSYIDYLITQLYYANRDWPGNNQKCWRVNTGGGKWRFVMFDLEYSMGLYDFNPAMDMFSFAADPNGSDWPNPPWSTLPIRSLFENQGFREEFIGRYLALLNTTLSSGRIIHVIDSLQADISDEYAAHTSLWNEAPPMATWEYRVEELREFVRQRPGHVLDNMQAFFGLGPSVQVHMESTGNRGTIMMNGVQVPDSGNGFSGTYLAGTEMKVYFEERPGYSLDHWEISTILSKDTTLLPRNSAWRYLDNGSYPGDAWNTSGFDDSGWQEGKGELGYGDGGEATLLDYGADPDNKYISYYFRKTAEVKDAAALSSIDLQLMRDDGVVIYVNGQEALRDNMPEGEILPETFADPYVGGDEESYYFIYQLDPGLFRDGSNVIAVEVHQNSSTSSDISFDMEITAHILGESMEDLVMVNNPLILVPESEINIRAISSETNLDLNLVINEVMSSNRDALLDELGRASDWIEVYNAGNETVDLAGLWFTDSLGFPLRWRIPSGFPDETSIAPGEFLVFYASGDPEAGPRHLDFQLNDAGEEVGLCYMSGSDTVWVDSLSYTAQMANRSNGYFPDGTGDWLVMAIHTPGTSNLYTGIEEPVISQPEVRIYPNPARSLLHIEFLATEHTNSGSVYVDVTDLTGRYVMREEVVFQPGPAHHMLDISSLNPGLYIIRVGGPFERQSFRFIKVN